MRFRALGRMIPNRFLFMTGELRLQSISDGFGDFTLDHKHICYFSIVGVCP